MSSAQNPAMQCPAATNSTADTRADHPRTTEDGNAGNTAVPAPQHSLHAQPVHCATCGDDEAAQEHPTEYAENTTTPFITDSLLRLAVDCDESLASTVEITAPPAQPAAALHHEPPTLTHKPSVSHQALSTTETPCLHALRDVTNLCIGDFTDNSLLFTGDGIVRVPHKNRPVLSAGRATRRVPTPPAQETGTDIYMSSILGLVERLSARMDGLAQRHTAAEAALAESARWLRGGCPAEALQAMRPFLPAPEPLDAVRCAVVRDCRPALAGLQAAMARVGGTATAAHGLFVALTSQMERRLSDNDRLRDMLKTQQAEHEAQLAALAHEAGGLKDGITDILHALEVTEAPAASQLASDLLERAGAAARAAVEARARAEADAAALKEENARLRVRLSEEGIARQTVRLRTAEGECTRLREQNMSFSRAMQRLSEQGVRAKQAAAALSAETRRLTALLQARDETVARQKALINLFQDKLGGSCQYSISELRRRKAEIDRLLVCEADGARRATLQGALRDCERRIRDFQRLSELDANL